MTGANDGFIKSFISLRGLLLLVCCLIMNEPLRRKWNKLFVSSFLRLSVKKEMACISECKWLCITAYVLAALGALVLAYNLLCPLGIKSPFKPPVALTWAYFIGAVITLYCGLRWAFMMEGKRA